MIKLPKVLLYHPVLYLTFWTIIDGSIEITFKWRT